MEPKTDSKEVEKIAILGAGNWGTALALHLHDNNYEVNLWEYHKSYYDELVRYRENRRFLKGFPLPDDIGLYNDLEQAVSGKNIIILAIPSHAVRSAANKLKDCYSKNSIIVSLVKGIENDSLMLISQVISDVIPEICSTVGTQFCKRSSSKNSDNNCVGINRILNSKENSEDFYEPESASLCQ